MMSAWAWLAFSPLSRDLPRTLYAKAVSEGMRQRSAKAADALLALG